MTHQTLARRAFLKGGTSFLGLSVLQIAGPERLLGQTGSEVIPWLDQPPHNPVPEITGNLLR